MVEGRPKKESHSGTSSLESTTGSSKKAASLIPGVGAKKKFGSLNEGDSEKGYTDTASLKPDRREEVARDMGLCKHCERRETCRRPCPEGGVWHCDDYL